MVGGPSSPKEENLPLVLTVDGPVALKRGLWCLVLPVYMWAARQLDVTGPAQVGSARPESPGLSACDRDPRGKGLGMHGAGTPTGISWASWAAFLWLSRAAETPKSSGAWSVNPRLCPEQCCYAHPPAGILSEFMAGSRVRAAI